MSKSSEEKKGIIISISSDIGMAIAKDWKKRGWSVFGTFRTHSPSLEELQKKYHPFLVHCDLLDLSSIQKASSEIISQCEMWDALVLGPGALEPIGNFDRVDFDTWEKSLHINLIQQLRMVHTLLPMRKKNAHPPTVIFFAGGGTNNAVLHYSSYTLAKISLIKMCELLAAEIPDTRFVIIGPGYVDTKIHKATLQLGEQGGKESYQNLVDRLARGTCTPMQNVVDCCNWLIETKCNDVSGRNFSVVFDEWQNPLLEEQLKKHRDMYKLRRYMNQWDSTQEETLQG